MTLVMAAAAFLAKIAADQRRAAWINTQLTQEPQEKRNKTSPNQKVV
jgi:hypothetical protein